MQELNVIVGGGADHYCKNCKQTADNFEKVVAQKFPDLKINFSHRNITTPEFIKQFGTLMPPCLIIEDIIVHDGSIPTESMIEKAIKHFI
jgi:disulfide oxidoreductase YuzD